MLQNLLQRCLITYALGFSVILEPSVTLAQITPDLSLGVGQSSRSPSNLIEGGVQRGANLFHSFSEFNVGDGNRVDFANPMGVDRIFTRVTGNARSEILGTLGVLGNADLFLLNPNGILFGRNARLEVLSIRHKSGKP